MKVSKGVCLFCLCKVPTIIWVTQTKNRSWKNVVIIFQLESTATLMFFNLERSFFYVDVPEFRAFIFILNDYLGDDVSCVLM